MYIFLIYKSYYKKSQIILSKILVLFTNKLERLNLATLWFVTLPDVVSKSLYFVKPKT